MIMFANMIARVARLFWLTPLIVVVFVVVVVVASVAAPATAAAAAAAAAALILVQSIIHFSQRGDAGYLWPYGFD